MSDIPWTADQRLAIETVDRSVAVSAAAGSGKTAALAARCIYLTCDAPRPYRCSIDELLVREGYARAWTRDGQHRETLMDLERDARENGVGCLW